MKNNYSGFRHYRHLRRVDGQVDQIATRGGITMAFEASKHVNDLGPEDTVRIGFSFCSGSDNFEREAGRTVAKQRLALDQTGIPGHIFREMLHANTVSDLYFKGLVKILDEEQGRNFRRSIKATVGNC